MSSVPNIYAPRPLRPSAISSLLEPPSGIVRMPEGSTWYLEEVLNCRTGIISIDFSGNDLVSDAVVGLIARRFRHLKELNLSGCTRITVKAIQIIAQSTLQVDNLYIRGLSDRIQNAACDLGSERVETVWI